MAHDAGHGTAGRICRELARIERIGGEQPREIERAVPLRESAERPNTLYRALDGPRCRRVDDEKRAPLSAVLRGWRPVFRDIKIDGRRKGRDAQQVEQADLVERVEA